MRWSRNEGSPLVFLWCSSPIMENSMGEPSIGNNLEFYRIIDNKSTIILWWPSFRPNSRLLATLNHSLKFPSKRKWIFFVHWHQHFIGFFFMNHRLSLITLCFLLVLNPCVPCVWIANKFNLLLNTIFTVENFTQGLKVLHKPHLWCLWHLEVCSCSLAAHLAAICRAVQYVCV